MRLFGLWSRIFNVERNTCQFWRNYQYIYLPITLISFRYFGAARDLPGVRELFEQERVYFTISYQNNQTNIL